MQYIQQACDLAPKQFYNENIKEKKMMTIDINNLHYLYRHSNEIQP